MAAAGVQQAMGEDVAALRVGGQLDLVDGEEVDLAAQRHRLHGADEVLGMGRDDLLLARNQRHRAGPAQLDDPVVDLAREQAQRQADHARAVAQHALDRQVRLAGVGGAQHRDQTGRRGPGGAVAHAWHVGEGGIRGKAGWGVGVQGSGLTVDGLMDTLV